MNLPEEREVLNGNLSEAYDAETAWPSGGLCNVSSKSTPLAQEVICFISIEFFRPEVKITCF